MFKKKYELHEYADRVTVRDNRVRPARVLILIIWLIAAMVLTVDLVSSGEDFIAGIIIFAAIILASEILLWMCECKYIITDEYIKMQYGFFGKKLWYRDMERCFYNSSAFITLIDNRGRENTIELIHLDGEYDDYFINPIQRSGVPVRKIGVFEKSEEISSYRYKFKMYQKGRLVLFIFFAICMIFLDVLIAMAIAEEAVDTSFDIIMAVAFIGNTILWLCIIANFTTVFYVDGDKIIYSRCLRKKQILNIKDISWVNTEIVHQSNNGAGTDVETMNIYVAGEELKWKVKPSRSFSNYDMLVAFLQDSGVPFSLEKKELLTYEKVEGDSKKSTHELLNLEEYAFTVNEENIIENGIFQGKRLIDESTEEIDYTPFIKKFKHIDQLQKLLLGSVWIVLIVTILLARLELLDFIAAILLPISLWILGLLVSNIENILIIKEVKKNAKLYKATVLKADVLREDKYVIYAYEDADTIKLIEPLEINPKLSQEQWKERYGNAINIWADLDKFPYCMEASGFEQDVVAKKIKKLVLLTLLSIITIALTAFAEYRHVKVNDNVISPKNDYENVLIEYDDNGTFYDEQKMNSSTSVYKWGADLTSLYAYMENGDPSILTGHDVDDEIYDETVEFLAKAWDITGRESAKEVIDRMITYGHQSKYQLALEDEDVQRAIDAIEDVYGKDFSYEDAKRVDEDFFEDNGISKQEFFRVKGAACAYVRFGENALTGYDYLRLVRVIALSYECGYLTEEEEYQLLYNIEKELQENYDSFQEIHECYYYGEMFRLGDKNDESIITINDISDAIDEMNSKRYYQKIERRYENEIIFEAEE